MKTNSIKTIRKTIQLLDKRISELLLEKEIDVNKIDTLSNVRILYTEELKSLISMRNTRDMFKKGYNKNG
jgi:hypothetical protein